MNPGYLKANPKEVNHNSERTNIKCRYGNSNVYYQKDTQGRTIQIVRPAIVKIK